MGLTLRLDHDSTAFHPGDSLDGTVTWELDKEPQHLDISLLWFTDGKGTRDVGVPVEQRIDHPGRRGERAFHFDLPRHPWSFSGTLITLTWAVEVSCSGETPARREFVLSPTDTEIRLSKPTDSG